MQKEVTTIRLPPLLKRKLEAYAKKKRRTMTSIIMEFIERLKG